MRRELESIGNTSLPFLPLHAQVFTDVRGHQVGAIALHIRFSFRVLTGADKFLFDSQGSMMRRPCDPHKLRSYQTTVGKSC